MIAFIPVDFAVMQKELQEAQAYDKDVKGAQSFLYKKQTQPTKDKKDKKKKVEEEEQKSPFEEIKELIYDPVLSADQKTMKVTKGRDYHEKIARIVFMNIMPDDLVWRRVIKTSIVHLSEDTQNSIFWMGKLIKPLHLAIDYEYVQFADIQELYFEDKPREDFYYKMDDLDPEVMPADSMSGIMRKFKVYPVPHKSTTPVSASFISLTDNPVPRKKVYDYEVEDCNNAKPVDTLRNTFIRPGDDLDDAFANPALEDPKKSIKHKVDQELRNLNRSEQ